MLRGQQRRTRSKGSRSAPAPLMCLGSGLGTCCRSAGAVVSWSPLDTPPSVARQPLRPTILTVFINSFRRKSVGGSSRQVTFI
jgi:hypothetical protein